ncbi:electron transfer flavoprotein subunit alpha/FixB family protein [Gleimia sp. 6138-11-ORH1]|uniref:electron transfer flavoprotein subunit alpha/FixB family protein n=1 Tax=Gleimia sp. 6138-11-ORH1 TaxID=2973937 RepID=UPI002168E47C|nr:electron transfer flavoprotein subunit alpha/FixB family protein [Gleimia sp. 6138-11-ORH1]MCS4484127.1 electron transfer flavoprotein subunit alpha/FixB family protein [Gleimia sp. 6138-11-ORH1]
MLNAPILVITDHTGSETEGFKLTGPSAQLLTLARSLTTAEIHALALNPAPDLTALGKYGVTQVYSPEFAGLSPRVASVVADCALAVLTASSAPYAAILNVSNYRGREVAGILAAKLGSGAAVDVTACQIVDGSIEASKTILAGTWSSTFKVTRGTPIISLRASAVEALPAENPTSPAVTTIPVEFSPASKTVKVIASTEQGGDGRISLTEAPVVVVGGRGTDGDFTLVEELADTLGAGVGATRVACDEGWIDRTAQVGQTGVTIAPRIYIGLGVSGAIHHTCGIQASQKIVAICDDPDAPIFELTDFGIVGDINEVIPQALEILKNR